MYEAGEWLEHYAPGYHNLTPAERSALSDFVLLWSLFEGQVLDRDATVNLLFASIEKWQKMGVLENDLIDDAWIYFVDRYTAAGAVTDHFRGLRLNRPEHSEFLEKALLADAPDAQTRNKALALIIYRLRNNLLHGEKWLYRLVDQEGNFRSAAHVLMVWMDINRGC